MDRYSAQALLVIVVAALPLASKGEWIRIKSIVLEK